MPQRSKLKLPSIPELHGKESVGQRLAKLRKERGYSQIELAQKMGLVQQLVTAYERDTRRLHAEMVVRFAKAFDVSTDEILLGTKAGKATGKLSLKIVRRLHRIEGLPEMQQKVLLKSIDLLLDGASG